MRPRLIVLAGATTAAALGIAALALPGGLRLGKDQPAASRPRTVIAARAAQGAAACAGEHWVAAWTADPSGLVTAGASDQTLRVILSPHLGGSELRVRVSNLFGQAPVTFARASVGLRRSGAALVSGSIRRLTFGGRASVTMSAGGEATSDPARLSFGAFEDLAVSLYLAGSSGPATGHLIGRQLSYESAASTGDHVAEASAGAFANSATTVDYVDEVDTLAPASTGAVVALGDSITDGYESPGATGAASLAGIGLDHRYPDYLARRLLRQRGAPRLSVVNAGISGNQLLVDEQSNGFGLSAFSRLDTDVLGVAGVSEAIVLEGINDIAAQTGAAAVEGALGQIVGRLHANGIRVLVGTIMPAGTGAFNLGSVDPGVYVDTPADGVRAAVNSWIRSGGSGADGVVDFDAAMRSPAVPNELNPIFDSGDHIHPNDLGYSVMSAAIDLSSLRASRCAQASDTSPAPAS